MLFKVLDKWQRENKISLFRVVVKGEGIIIHTGEFEYVKTRYKFLLLAELI
jgi:hypothetical protein